MEKAYSEIQGIIERITYFNSENGFTIAKLKVYDRHDLVTVAGTMQEMNPGEIVLLKGEWFNHPKFGEQFKIHSYESKVPSAVQGIEKYLGSGLIKGIGPVMARRIVKKFGKETLNIIDNDIANLIKVEGIGQKRVDMIAKAWAEQKEVRQVMVFLQSHGVSSAYASKIFRQYGNTSIAVVKDNPYRLATDIFGIGFVTADRIAEKLGFAKDSAVRAQAGILYVLHQLSEEGHVYYPQNLLMEEARKILEIPAGIIETALQTIWNEQRIVIEDLQDDVKTKAVYLAKFHLSETSIAARFKILFTVKRTIRDINTEKAIAWVQERLKITLAEKQQEAVASALTNKVMVVTGGPGTGKTTIIRSILEIFKAMHVRILLAAPTGRAAKRMSETTGHEAKTIHRLLEYSQAKGGFQCDDENPLDCDLLIVDEMSMVDTVLMHHLTKAIPRDAAVILVGDINQLPSVGAGNVLKDIIDSGKVPVVELKEIFRQAKESSIIINAHRINKGELPIWEQNLKELDDFYFIQQEDPQKVLEVIVSLVKDRIPKRFGLHPINDVQVLTPMQKGSVGGINLNVELQKALNHSTEGITRGGRRFLTGDKVMQIKNNYDKEIFNGDIGRIASVASELQEMTIIFDDREIVFDYSELDEIIHAYAVSIHKSQGSEYPAIIVPMLTQHYVMLQRNLLYTAVTRGKKLVVLIGSKKALFIAVKNDKMQKRYSWLSERLKDFL